MNKKIYYQQNVLVFAEAEAQTAKNQSIRSLSSTRPDTLEKFISAFLSEQNEEQAEQIKNFSAPLAYFEQVMEHLRKKFYYIEAAGGLIRRNNDCLFIYRLGKWDLPKGKIDPGESREAAALRECEEECGIRDLKISEQLSSTYHLYRYKDGFALKQTYWYFMLTSYSKKLVPQSEENIEKAEWISSARVTDSIFPNTYFTIRDVVTEAMQRQLI